MVLAQIIWRRETRMDWMPYPIKEQIHISEFYTMFKDNYDKTYVFPGETHNFWECVFVLSGSICVSADNRIYNMNAGEIIFHKPYELHKFYITGEKNAELFIFSYTAKGELCDYFSDKVFYLSEKQQKILENLMDYMYSQIKKLNLNDKNEQGNMYLIPFGRIPAYSQTVVTQIYSLFFSLFNSSEAIPVSTSHDSVLFSEAVNYMNKRIYGNPSIEEISKQVCISQAGLKRIFKKYTGLGIHKYFLKLKLKLAAEMLENGISVTDTAEKLGFSSQGYFTKTFQRETGILPSLLCKNKTVNTVK